MEFVDLSRYRRVERPSLPPFARLRTMAPLALTPDLQLVDEPENLAYADALAADGVAVVPVRRRPPTARFLDRHTFPRRVLFEMTSRCNYRCRMCPQQDLKRPRIDMPGPLYRRVLDELDTHGIEGLWLYHLGESLLHPEFIENVRHVSTKRNLGIVWMSTNGRYFAGDRMRAVLESTIDWVNFSAHAVTAETYGTVAPRQHFETVQRNLDAFIAAKGGPLPKRPFLHCQMIEQETTRHEVDAFLARHHQRAEIVSVNMLEYVNLPNNAFGHAQRERAPLTSCLRVTRNDCFICSNGHVTLCDAAYNGEIYLGDVHETSLWDIWNGPHRQRVLELNAQGRMREIELCRTCTDYDI
ncbi:MAG: SPASM domain-containing protein [Candidatus Binatia bacterium]